MNGPNEELHEELTEVVRHRAAISEVLRAIASSPDDLQPLFDPSSAARYASAEPMWAPYVCPREKLFVS
jgi:hypothetical protein